MDTVIKYLTLADCREAKTMTVESIDFEDIRLPRDTMCFVTYNLDDNGERINSSPIYAFGKRYSYDEAKSEFGYSDEALVMLTAVLEGLCENDCDLIHFFGNRLDTGMPVTHWEVFDKNHTVIVKTKPDPENSKQIIPIA